MKKGHLSDGIHNMQHLLILCGKQVKKHGIKNQDPSVWTATQWQRKPIKNKNKGVIQKLKSGLITKQIDIYTWRKLRIRVKTLWSTSSSTVRLLLEVYTITHP
jgi:hypothetical protein